MNTNCSESKENILILYTEWKRFVAIYEIYGQTFELWQLSYTPFALKIRANRP
jgi:hypothetical protein